MNKFIKNILAQVAVVAASVLGVTACTPKVIVDQPGSTIQVDHDAAGATSVRVTPREEPNPARPTPPVVVTQMQPETDTARRELADLQTQRDSVRRELAEAVKDRDQAANDRANAAAGAEQAQRAAATLRDDVNRLSASKVALEKELGDLTSRRDKNRTKLADGQHAADVLAGEAKRLTGLKAAAEQELATATTSVQNAKSALASADAAVAAGESRVSTLKKQQAEVEAALATAQAKLESVTADTTKAAANLDDLRSQIETKKHELAGLAADAAEPGGKATTQPTPAAQTGTPTDATTDGVHASPAGAPSETGSPTHKRSGTGSPQPNGSGESRQTPLAPAAEHAPTWRMATLGAASVLGLAAIAGILIWLAARGCYTCLIHSFKTGQDVSRAIRRGWESVVMTADGAATMTPVECLHPGDTYVSVNAFGRPVLWAGNGVHVNGEAVPAGSSIKLQPGTRISVRPDAVFEFRSCLRSDTRDESETVLAA